MKHLRFIVLCFLRHRSHSVTHIGLAHLHPIIASCTSDGLTLVGNAGGDDLVIKIRSNDPEAPRGTVDNYLESIGGDGEDERCKKLDVTQK